MFYNLFLNFGLISIDSDKICYTETCVSTCFITNAKYPCNEIPSHFPLSSYLRQLGKHGCVCVWGGGGGYFGAGTEE